MVGDCNYKMNLNNYCMQRQLGGPKYEAECRTLASKPAFRAKVTVAEQVFQSIEGKLYPNKKQAEQSAAFTAWEVLKVEVEQQLAAEENLKSTPYKTILQEHLLARDLEKPEYLFERKEGEGYFAQCHFEGQEYKTSTPFLNKKTAEQEAAKLALEGMGILNLESVVARRMLRAKRVMKQGVSWRSGMESYFQQKDQKPDISSVMNNGTYRATVKTEEGTFQSPEVIKFFDEDSAINAACKAACNALSIHLHLPASMAQPVETEGLPKSVDVIMDHPKGEEVLAPSAGLKRSIEEFHEARNLKRRRVDDTWAVPKALLAQLIVVEVWPEKKNVAVVGFENFSCPFLCLNPDQKCQIDVNGKMTDLEPGMVLENVEAVFKDIPFCGGMTMLANTCAKISKVKPSFAPVLTGAGVLVMTREEETIKVLLKRYRTTMAFIAAAQELSFGFRRAGAFKHAFFDASGVKKPRHNPLMGPWTGIDVEKVTKNMHLWTDQEVEALRTLDKDLMMTLFSVTKWRWNERWNGILEGKTATELKKAYATKPTEAPTNGVDATAAEAGPTPDVTNGTKETPKVEVKEEEAEEEDGVPLRKKYGFDEVAEFAEAEYHRRQSMKGEPEEELSYRPWGLPRGGFRHQNLSTGVHIESTAECARRELKEECGITLRLKEMEEEQKVVVLRTDRDNLNPHKGDASVYYFHEVDSEVAKSAGKPIQDVIDISKNPKMFGPSKKSWHQQFNDKRFHLFRQKEVHEEFAWFTMEDADLLSPIFKYMNTTTEFRKFAKLPIDQISEPEAARGKGRGRRR